MLTRDSYIALLEKRAQEESSVPNIDSSGVAENEYEKNLKDSNTILHELFTQATSTESNQSSEAKKLFPGSDHEMHRESGNPLMKVAKSVFLDIVQSTEFSKTASPLHLELAFGSFCNELAKIAALKPQTMSQLSQKNNIAMKMPPKTWNIGGPAAMGGAGSGTSLNAGGGILGRAKKALGF